MSTEVNPFEARAYKRLYELYKSTLLTIINRARNAGDINDSERIREIMQAIGDEKKWDQYGIESKETAKIIDELEKCLGV